MPLKSYRELRVWQEGIELAADVYELTSSFPDSERFGMTAQLRRAVVGVPSNVAEGNVRSSRRDYRRFVDMARSAIAEIETQLILSIKLGLGDREANVRALARAESVGRMLTNLYASL